MKKNKPEPKLVPIPYNRRYPKNAESAYSKDGFAACVVCGKGCNTKDPKTYFIRLGPGGRSYAAPRDLPDQGPAEMGCDPVGNDCLRKYPQLKVYAFRKGDA